MASGSFKTADWFTRLTRGRGDRNLIGKVVREALTRFARGFWHRRILPQHFKEGAGRKYPGAYLPRTRNYTDRKQKKYGHRRPMVWTGTFMRGVLGHKPTVDSTTAGDSRSIKIKAQLNVGNRAANLWSGKQRRGAGNAHDFRRSLGATNRADKQKWIKFFRKIFPLMLRREQQRGQQKKTERYAA